MKPLYLESIKELLFTNKKLHTYAIVDPYRDETLIYKLKKSDLEVKNLLESHPKLGELYLIRLEKEAPLLEYLLDRHQKALAIYLLSPYDIESFSDYYRQFMVVEVAMERESREALFGCFDAMVFLNYIETLYSPSKVDELFRAIALYLIPDYKSRNFISVGYPTEQGSIEKEHFNLREKSKVEKIESVIKTFGGNKSPLGSKKRSIDHRQVKTFQQFAKKRFIESALGYYKKESYALLNIGDDYFTLAEKLFDEANEQNILSEGGVYRYILLGLLLKEPLSNFSFYRELISLKGESQKIKELDRLIEKWG